MRWFGFYDLHMFVIILVVVVKNLITILEHVIRLRFKRSKLVFKELTYELN